MCGVNEAKNKEYFREIKRELIEQTLSTQKRSCVEKRTLYFWYDVDSIQLRYFARVVFYDQIVPRQLKARVRVRDFEYI